MSNDIQKADQIAYRIFTKLSLVLNQARSTVEPKSQPKVDKWFNLETPDSDIFRDHLRIYRSVSAPTPPPPLEIQVLLFVPELTNNQVLVYQAPDSSRVRINPTPRYILLETWSLVFSTITTQEQQQQQYGEDSGEVAPSTIYKHGITLFRSLFTLLRVQPAWKLFKKLRRRTGGGNRNGNLGIQLRVAGMDEESGDILGFDTPLAAHTQPLTTDTHVFPSVPHPMGTLSLTVRYLTTPNFQLDELESLLSSRFLSLEEGPEFTPTLAKNQQRDSSISGSPGSLPRRTTLPKSPPSSIADRFVLPAPIPPPLQTRTTSLPQTSQSPRNVPLPIGRVSTAAPTPTGSGSGISVGSSRQDTSSTWSKDDGPPLSGLAARLRRESTGAGRGADLPSSPGPLPIRRPNINPVHPFKSPALSSGSSLHSGPPSIRQPSPLSSTGIPSLPSRPFPTTSPTSSRMPMPPSPIGMGSKPSPPFAPSSLGDRRSLASAEGDEQQHHSPSPRLGQRKRYSSSFSYRYNNSGGAGSEGSAGSGERERRDSERVGTGSFLSNHTDEDDISVFVQDIDTRKPLSGHRRFRSHDTAERTRLRVEDDRPIRGLLSVDDPQQPPASGTSPGPMLTSELEVDEKLKQMNQVFLESLEGLGGRRRDRDRDRRSSLPRRRDMDLDSELSSEPGRVAIGDGSRESGLGVARRRDSEGSSGGGGRGFMLPRRPPLESRNTSTSDVGGVQGSDEVLGRLSLGDDRGERSREQ